MGVNRGFGKVIRMYKIMCYDEPHTLEPFLWLLKMRCFWLKWPLRKIKGTPHLNSIIPCNVTGYPTLHDPVPAGQVPPLFGGLLHKILRLKMENKF